MYASYRFHAGQFLFSINITSKNSLLAGDENRIENIAQCTTLQKVYTKKVLQFEVGSLIPTSSSSPKLSLVIKVIKVRLTSNAPKLKEYNLLYLNTE